MFKCEFVGANALVPNELRTYHTLFDVHWVKAYVMEVSMSISGFCIMLVCILVLSYDSEKSR